MSKDKKQEVEAGDGTYDQILKRLDELEAENKQLKTKIAPIKDGRGIEIPDGLKVDPSVVRIKVLPDLVAKPGFKVRYASKYSIQRRLSEGWQRIEGVGEVGDAIPIEIPEDNPLLLQRKAAQEYLKNQHHQKLTDEAAQGRVSHPGGVSTFTEYERRRE